MKQQTDDPVNGISAGILIHLLLHLEAVRMTSCLWSQLKKVQEVRSCCLLLASQR